ncbi:hypothetical protein LXA43DRAFT_1065062, partial [Ganoderma leucocontextum]
MPANRFGSPVRFYDDDPDRRFSSDDDDDEELVDGDANNHNTEGDQAFTAGVAPQQDPFDHDRIAIPTVFQDGQGASQDEVYAAIMERTRMERSTLEKYKQTKLNHFGASVLRRMYENHESTRAMALLHSKLRLVVDEEYTVDPQDPNVVFGVKE